MEFYVGFSHQQHHYHHSKKAFGLIKELYGLKGPQISSKAPVEYLFLLVFGPGDRHWSPWIYFSVSHSIRLPYFPLIPWQLTLPWVLFLQESLPQEFPVWYIQDPNQRKRYKVPGMIRLNKIWSPFWSLVARILLKISQNDIDVNSNAI